MSACPAVFAPPWRWPTSNTHLHALPRTLLHPRRCLQPSDKAVTLFHSLPALPPAVPFNPEFTAPALAPLKMSFVMDQLQSTLLSGEQDMAVVVDTSDAMFRTQGLKLPGGTPYEVQVRHVLGGCTWDADTHRFCIVCDPVSSNKSCCSSVQGFIRFAWVLSMWLGCSHQGTPTKVCVCRLQLMHTFTINGCGSQQTTPCAET